MSGMYHGVLSVLCMLCMVGVYVLTSQYSRNIGTCAYRSDHEDAFHSWPDHWEVDLWRLQ